MPRQSAFLVLLGAGLLAATVHAAPSPEKKATIQPAPAVEYPKTPTVNQVDDYFGTKVADPYRWLEDDVRTSDAVAGWVDAQNKVTFAYLNSIPERAAIKERLTRLWDYERYTSPFKAGDFYYFLKNDGLQNQSIYYRSSTVDGVAELVLDPNTWSKDGTVSLGALTFSDDGSKLAYAVSRAGSDWTEWHVRDMATMKDDSDTLRWVKFSGVEWTKDGSGMFYSRFVDPDTTHKYITKNEHHKLFFHKLGTPQSEDRLIFERTDQPEWLVSGKVSDDGRWLLIEMSHTGPQNLLTYLDLTAPNARPVPLLDEWEASYDVIGTDGTVFYLVTDLDAPKKRIVAIDITKPEKENWKTLIPEGSDVLKGVKLLNTNYFVVQYLKDAYTQVRIYDLKGQFVRDVALPGIGTAGGFGGKRHHTETFYSYASFTTPPSIYRYDLVTGESRLIRQAKVDFNPDDFTTSQIFYTTKDGTKIPMFLAHRKDIAMTGNNPTLLYGYGGFSISTTPSFSVSRVAWMEMGGVLALPCLRGGGEYGEEWHLAGTKEKKQNVFDDFIAAAEWLIANKYTRPERLAIQGGSNGGLLVGAVMAQRPDLFGAALPAVGVMDMLRYHKFTIGRAWAYDYGTSDDEAGFRALYAYSPYHNLKPGVRYPATLITTADTDDRVVPGHSFKFAAALQAAQAGSPPTLIRIETSAGHGGGKPTTKIINEVSDQLAFLARSLGMTLPKAGSSSGGPGSPAPSENE
jgi:prolyl oligopeptidase